MAKETYVQKWLFWIVCTSIITVLGTVGALAKYQVEHNHPTTAKELEHLHESVDNNRRLIKDNGNKISAGAEKQSELITGQAVQTEILKRVEGIVQEIKEKK